MIFLCREIDFFHYENDILFSVVSLSEPLTCDQMPLLDFKEQCVFRLLDIFFFFLWRKAHLLNSHGHLFQDQFLAGMALLLNVLVLPDCAKMFHPMQSMLGSCKAQMISSGICFFQQQHMGL